MPAGFDVILPLPAALALSWLNILLQMLLISYLAVVPSLRLAEVVRRSPNVFGEGTPDGRARWDSNKPYFPLYEQYEQVDFHFKDSDSGSSGPGGGIRVRLRGRSWRGANIRPANNGGGEGSGEMPRFPHFVAFFSDLLLNLNFRLGNASPPGCLTFSASSSSGPPSRPTSR